MYLGEEEGTRDGREEDTRCLVGERWNIEAKGCDWGVGRSGLVKGEVIVMEYARTNE